MLVAFRSDKGKIRENNEDSILADKDNGIFLLADGMGGHEAGEVASDIAVREAYSYLKDMIDAEKDIGSLLMEAMNKANDAILKQSRTLTNLAGMGTTLVLVIIRDDKAHICHAGDSRVYLIHKGIKQITRDQTVWREFIEKGTMEQKAIPSFYRHILTQAAGTSEHIEPETSQIELKKGDMLLVCSDGLTDMLADEEIKDIIETNKDHHLDKALDCLVDKANEKGGRDNISVVLVRYE